VKQNRVRYSAPIPVKLDKELLTRLDEISKRIGEPRSTVMRMAMRLGLEALETIKVTDHALAAMMRKLDAPSEQSNEQIKRKAAS
jgi:metal-responsive CopG/Arc/MetJ family transcriptional regulator